MTDKHYTQPEVASVLGGESRYCLINSDCLEALKSIPDCSIDSIVTDPPSSIGFMGIAWDKDKGSDLKWVRWLAKVLKRCHRVLKPGGYCVIWSLPRTVELSGMAMRLAGFERRDSIEHVFGSGFPKSLNVSLAIDKEDGLLSERQVVHEYEASGNAGTSTKDKGGTYSVGVENSEPVALAITRGATEKSRAWDGFGTGLKPAHETWLVGRKALDGRIIDNCLKHGTGAYNIDRCRVFTDWDEADRPESWKQSAHTADASVEKIAAPPGDGIQCHPLGRWPANFVMTHDHRCRPIAEVNDQIERATTETHWPKTGLLGVGGTATKTTTTTTYDCVEGCPVKALNEQSGELTSGTLVAGTPRANTSGFSGPMPAVTNGHLGDSGGASRFFNCFEWDSELDNPFIYLAKPSTAERELGCEHLTKRSAGEITGGREEDSAGLNNPRAGAGRKSGGRHNHHPTLKSIALMRHLIKLVTPPGGVTLSPFYGSGTDGCAALLDGFRSIGIEQESSYCDVARARIEYWAARGTPSRPKPQKADPRQTSIFDLLGAP